MPINTLSCAQIMGCFQKNLIKWIIFEMPSAVIYFYLYFAVAVFIMKSMQTLSAKACIVCICERWEPELFPRWPSCLPSASPQHGSNLIGMTDLNVPEQLYQYMVGGHRRTHAGINREKHKSPSYQIKVESLHNHQRACIHLEIFWCWE